MLGGDAALSRLLDAAHAVGIRVVGDLTTNHTGDHHDWFEVARTDPTSAERGFYRFDRDDTYVSWLDIASLPKLDHSSVELARRLYDGPDSVVARWLREGLDGWRVDVANMTGRLGADDLAHQVARTVRRTIADVRADGWLLAEHGHDASLDLDGTGWHGTMDYAGFTRPVWCWLNGGSPTHPVEPPGLPHGLNYLGLPIDIPVVPAESAVATMREMHAAMPWQSLVSSTMHLDSHDVPRFRTVTGGGTDGWIDTKGHGRDRHLVGLAMQMTMPGVPVVFMGDEIGLTGVDGEHARTPFPWSRSDEWDDATLAAYRTWIGVRRDHVALRRGGLRWLGAEGDSITYLREHPEQTVLVHLTAQRARRPGCRWPRSVLACGGSSPSRAHAHGSPATRWCCPVTVPPRWWQWSGRRGQLVGVVTTRSAVRAEVGWVAFSTCPARSPGARPDGAGSWGDWARRGGWRRHGCAVGSGTVSQVCGSTTVVVFGSASGSTGLRGAL